MSRGPVFVMGASRSGTAMLRSMLNNSPDLHIAGETHYFDDLRTVLGPGATAVLTPEQQAHVADYFLALAHRPYGHGGVAGQSRMDPGALRHRAEELGNHGDAWFQAFCELHAVLEGGQVTKRWGEKTPRHIFRLPEILTTFPDSQVVVMVRDPRAVAASYENWSNRGGLELEQDYVAALEVEEARAAASYDPTVSAMLWRGGVRAAASALRAHGRARVRIQRYEDLVADPEGQLAELGSFLGLHTEADMLDVPMHNSSFAAFDRQGGVSQAPVARWKGLLDERDVATIQFWAGHEMRALGYETAPVDLGPIRRGGVVLAAGAATVRAIVANRHRAGNLPGYVLRRARSAFLR